MGLTISFGNAHHSLDFRTAIRMVEYGLRKYGEVRYEKGILTAKNTHPTAKKLFDWIDDQSPNYTWCYGFTLETLSLDELDFVYQLMCDFREEGTSIDGNSYDSPLTAVNIKQLDEAISATKLYIEARKNGIEKQGQS